MKTLLFCTLTLCCFIFQDASSQAVYSLRDIHTDAKKPSLITHSEATNTGGRVTYTIDYGFGNKGIFDYQWSFDKPVDQIQEGETITVTLKCNNCESQGGYKKSSMWVSGANNASHILKDLNIEGYVYNGNLSADGTVKGYEPDKSTAQGTITFKYLKTAPQSFFKIGVSGVEFEALYLYDFGAKTVAKDVNCHTLLGLGVNLGILEVGTYEGYSADYLLKAINYALNHVKATNCLNPSYLEGLKSRIAGASDTTVFYDEVKAYRKGLDAEIKKDCACCVSCQQ